MKPVKGMLLPLLISAIAVGAFLILANPFSGESGHPICRDCNVIIVSIDFLRPDHLGFNGYFRDTSPNLDRFAGESFVFDRAYSPSLFTYQSDSVLLTGKRLSEQGTAGCNPVNIFLPSPIFQCPTAPLEFFLPTKLGEAGYRTAAFVTYGEFIDGRLGRMGFQEHNYSYGPFEGQVSRAEEWISRADQRPFFLWLQDNEMRRLEDRTGENFFDPEYSGSLESVHSSNRSLLSMSLWERSNIAGVFLENGTFSGKYEVFPQCGLQCANETVALIEERDVEHLIAEYDWRIRVADRKVGALLDFLERTGLSNRTIVVVTSEHGLNFRDTPDKQIGHMSNPPPWAVNYRIPIIVRIPGSEGRRLKGVYSSVDVAPTILDLVSGAGPSKRNLFYRREQFTISEEFVSIEEDGRAAFKVNLITETERALSFIYYNTTTWTLLDYFPSQDRFVPAGEVDESEYSDLLGFFKRAYGIE